MKILLDGYFDKNLGDDLMLFLAAEGLKEHELYIPSDKIELENAAYTTAGEGFDAYLKVTGSGFLIHNSLGIAYRLRDMRREKRYAPVRAVIGCNVDEFINHMSEAVIKKHLGQFDYITVRDDFSYNYIRNNLPRLNAEIFPDIVFSLPDSMIPDTSCENLLGIAVRGGADYDRIAQIADAYIRETGRGALLICLDSGAENDELAAEKVMAAAKYSDKIEIIRYENIADMLVQMKRCSVLLGMRLHSIVLAARMGIPFVPMLYSVKTLHALQAAGYKGEVYNAREFDVNKVTARVFCPEPFALPQETVRLAEQHIIKFNEYIKQQD